MNELLQRKHAWSPADLERFTCLYRSDHAANQAEEAASEALVCAEQAAEEVRGTLGRMILARYHEEQIWSDKIRRASTWGTWVLVGFNVLLFVVVQLGLEPWKRRRLVAGFEERVRDVVEAALLREAHTGAAGGGGGGAQGTALDQSRDSLLALSQEDPAASESFPPTPNPALRLPHLDLRAPRDTVRALLLYGVSALVQLRRRLVAYYRHWTVRLQEPCVQTNGAIVELVSSGTSAGLVLGLICGVLANRL